jgi:hypothetical protein
MIFLNEGDWMESGVSQCKIVKVDKLQCELAWFLYQQAFFVYWLISVKFFPRTHCTVGRVCLLDLAMTQVILVHGVGVSVKIRYAKLLLDVVVARIRDSFTVMVDLKLRGGRKIDSRDIKNK